MKASKHDPPMTGEGESDLRRGPWTSEEDNLLSHYIASHGEGHWNLLAKCAGLKRTGKSCRLRWLNYLKPDIKRGNLTPQEQLLILQLHQKWGNRWSKIAHYLPGRTDNEIKNYWRTRVQKQARQLNIEPNSRKFLEAIRQLWMPRLLQKIEQSSISPLETTSNTTTLDSPIHSIANTASPNSNSSINSIPVTSLDSPLVEPTQPVNLFYSIPEILEYPFNSSYENLLEGNVDACDNPSSDYGYHVNCSGFDMHSLAPKIETSTHDMSAVECQVDESHWARYDVGDTLWSVDDMWHGELDKIVV